MVALRSEPLAPHTGAQHERCCPADTGIVQRLGGGMFVDLSPQAFVYGHMMLVGVTFVFLAAGFARVVQKHKLWPQGNPREAVDMPGPKPHSPSSPMKRD